MRPTVFAAVAILLLARAVPAQHAGHAGATAADSAGTGMRHEGMAMRAGPLGIGMQREGSGTAWQPDASPTYAYQPVAGRWELMLHGGAFLQYVHEGSDRGGSEVGFVNWVHAMATRPAGVGRLGLRAMLSAEPVTVGKCGYPDLLATGEFCKGEPLHDRQHPHDLFMELAAQYQQPLGSSVAFELYGGLAGEPALGPVAFPHRTSALPSFLAPIGHHWQDATHISFGVATAGLYGRRWKVEGSVFNGREPDEDRFDLDLAPLDSYSGRVWVLPDERWALQASLARLTEAEAPREPGEGRADVTRSTVSVAYHQPVAPSGTWASTLVWGQNRAHGLATDAFLVESSLNLGERHVFFGRGELARKSGEDVAIETEAPALADDVFTLGKLSIGYVRQFGGRGTLLPGVGAQISVSFFPSDMEPFYGSPTPGSIAVFASLRPRPIRTEPPAVPVLAAAQALPEPQQDGHAGHAPAAPAGADADGQQWADGPMDMERMRLLDEIHVRMMADPVIRERAATDPVLVQLMQRMSRGMTGDSSGVHPGHPMGSSMDSTGGTMGGPEAEAREAMEFVVLLLSDPRVQARVHADPVLHRLWSDPRVQLCLETLRRIQALGQELPAACPAAAPAGGQQPSRSQPSGGP